jgi:hypothetical protein
MPYLRIVRNEVNCGVSKNCNRLLEMASGEILHFMAADDAVLPGFYSRCVDMLVRYPQAGMCYALCRKIDEQGSDVGPCGNVIPGDTPRYVPASEIVELFQKHFYLIGSTARLYRKQVVIELGGFRENLGSYSDGFLDYVNMARYGVCFVPEVLASWRIIGTSLSHTTGRDDVRLAQFMRLACQAMEREFGGIFPRDFIENYKYFALGRLGLDKWREVSSRRDHFLDLAQVHIFPDRTRLDRIFASAMKWLGRIERAMVETYLDRRSRR